MPTKTIFHCKAPFCSKSKVEHVVRGLAIQRQNLSALKQSIPQVSRRFKVKETPWDFQHAGFDDEASMDPNGIWTIGCGDWSLSKRKRKYFSWLRRIHCFVHRRMQMQHNVLSKLWCSIFGFAFPAIRREFIFCYLCLLIHLLRAKVLSICKYLHWPWV